MDVCKVDENVIQDLAEIRRIAEKLRIAKDGRRCPSVPYLERTDRQYERRVSL
jgi:hypothetical protein